ncbi:MAG: hypothetical protein JWP69_410 [Flaviaesturariibacter sp.]|nr:hypothetical protein [Flaviaesturariibacter sp.]
MSKILLFLYLSLFIMRDGFAQEKEDYYLVAKAVLKREKARSNLIDSAYNINFQDCFPPVFSRLQLTIKDSLSVIRQIRKASNFRWEKGRLANAIIPKSKARQTPYRNWIALSIPIFIDHNRVLILLDTLDGGQIFYLMKQNNCWIIKDKLCPYYY